MSTRPVKNWVRIRHDPATGNVWRQRLGYNLVGSPEELVQGGSLADELFYFGDSVYEGLHTLVGVTSINGQEIIYLETQRDVENPHPTG